MWLTTPAASRRLFSLGARLYAFTTGQAAWQRSGAELVRHFPPSAGPPRVLDLGCGPGMVVREVTRRVPGAHVVGLDIAWGMLADARRRSRQGAWLQADAQHLPLPAASLDVATAHSFLYLCGNRDEVLREVRRVLRPGGRLVLVEPRDGAALWPALRRVRGGVRFGVSAVLWHWYARHHGRFTTAGLGELLRAAGYTRVLAEETLGGLAVLARGERPYEDETPVVRVARTAAGRLAASPPASTLVSPVAMSEEAGGGRGEAGRGALYVLVQQKPNRPAWEALEEREEQALTWDVLAVAERATGRPHVLVFTSLARAVRFMQPAVLAGAAQGFNKVGKFSSERVRDWGLALTVDATYEEVKEQQDDMIFPGPALRVDHRQREKHHEESHSEMV